MSSGSWPGVALRVAGSEVPVRLQSRPASPHAVDELPSVVALRLPSSRRIDGRQEVEGCVEVQVVLGAGRRPVDRHGGLGMVESAEEAAHRPIESE
jgi:hypothetical protein